MTRLRSFLVAMGRVLALPAVWIPLLFLGSAMVGLALGSWKNLCAGCPSVAQIHTWEPQQTSKVYSHDGRLIAELGVERRTPIAIQALPPHLPQAFIAVEDRRFYSHGGFDLRGFSRAVIGVLMTGSFQGGGGSTITQQLARNMFETIGFNREGWTGIERKLKELQVAFELERAYSKDQILEAYMNQINLGPGWWGIQTASRNYFGKDAVEVNPAEAALLAAIANRPGAYSPFSSPDNARARRALVLERMEREGFLTREEAAEWRAYPLPESRAAVAEGIAPYFVEWVRQVVQSRLGSQLYTGGFHIITTLDVDIQRAAEASMMAGFERIEARPGFNHPRYAEYMSQTHPLEEVTTPYLQGALIATDPATGRVLALVGGRDFNHSKFNRALQARRQPGSSFKTFVYAAALNSGIAPSRVIPDNAIVREQGPELPLWMPQNFDGEFLGDMTLREAYRLSRNTVAILLAEEVGLETVAQTAFRLGIRTPIERVPSLALGAADVLPIQMAEAYNALAGMGVRSQLFPILRVETATGEVIWEPRPEQTRVMDPLSARLMVALMEDVVTQGTGSNGIRNVAGLSRDVPAAGKTGTTTNYVDVWFAGFTPTLQATVWFGMDQPQQIHPNATGGGDASPVWGDFMRRVYEGTPGGASTADSSGGSDPILPIPARWPLDGLTSREVDSLTGLLASPWCPPSRRYTEFYIPGTEPTEPCDQAAPSPGLRWPW